MAKLRKKSTSAANDEYPPEWDAMLTPAQKAMLSPAELRAMLKEMDDDEKASADELAEIAAVYDGVYKSDPEKPKSSPAKRRKKA